MILTLIRSLVSKLLLMMGRMILEFAKRNVRGVGRGNRSLFLIDPTWSGMSMVDGLDVEDEV